MTPGTESAPAAFRAPTSAAVAALVDRVRREPELRDELVPLLREDHPVYAGRGASSAARTRAWLLSVCAEVGLPDDALPAVLDDLVNEVDPVCVAGAAVAVRGLAAPPRPVANALLVALNAMRVRDVPVVLAPPGTPWSVAPQTSAVTEVLAALRWCRLDQTQIAELAALAAQDGWSAAARADLHTTLTSARRRAGRLCLDLCAGPATVPTGFTAAATPGTLAGVQVQDQSGERLSLLSYLAAAPTVVTFFYTRCTNPNKCSLTVTKLADLQRRLAGSAVQLAAVSYDPGYDLPGRMAVYGSARGLVFGSAVRMLRAVDGHDALLRFFRLRVGYNSGLVNRHAVEVFLMDGERIAMSRSQLPWAVNEVATAALALRHSSVATTVPVVGATVPVV